MNSQQIIPKESKASLKTTWEIYKLQWKTFLALTGFGALAWLVYTIIDIILSLIGLVPISVLSYTDYEYFGVGALLASFVIRLPIVIIYTLITSLLSVSFMVVPALYFKNNEIITWKVPYKVLTKNFKRYVLAGLLFSVCLILGYLFCIIPGIAISFVGPTFLNKIACSDMPIMKAFKSSFQAVFKSPNLWSYIGMSILAGLLFTIATTCTCFVGMIITFPMICIYSIHLAYNKGLIS